MLQDTVLISSPGDLMRVCAGKKQVPAQLLPCDSGTSLSGKGRIDLAAATKRSTPAPEGESPSAKANGMQLASPKSRHSSQQPAAPRHGPVQPPPAHVRLPGLSPSPSTLTDDSSEPVVVSRGSRWFPSLTMPWHCITTRSSHLECSHLHCTKPLTGQVMSGCWRDCVTWTLTRQGFSRV